VVLDEGHGGEQMIEQVMTAIADLGSGAV